MTDNKRDLFTDDHTYCVRVEMHDQTRRGLHDAQSGRQGDGSDHTNQIRLRSIRKDPMTFDEWKEYAQKASESFAIEWRGRVAHQSNS